MLVNLTLSDIARICNGTLLGDDCSITEIKTDTRQTLDGALFIALAGESFDGHNYIDLAFEHRAAAVLVQKEVPQRPAVLVDNTLAAYGEIAHYVRQKFSGKLISVTGSNGKTTVKEWLSQCLGVQFPVLKTLKNYNNQIGVPLTLLSIDKQHQFAVIEAGTSYIGEIPLLAKIIEPDIAIITNASGSHLSGFGSLENIAIEKGALISALSPDGVAVLNYDDAWFDYWSSLVKNKISFGFSDAADMTASNIKLHKNGSSCLINYRTETSVLELTTPGKHQIANAMAVLICLIECGVSLQQGIDLLKAPLTVSGRLEFFRANTQSLVLNDCYNASPTSVEAAIDVLSYQDEPSKWLVLGELRELGDSEHDVHKSIGEYAYHAGIDHLICVGSIAAIAGTAFEVLGGDSILCSDQQAVIDVLKTLDKNSAILVKGSRSSKMEKIIEKIVN